VPAGDIFGNLARVDGLSNQAAVLVVDDDSDIRTLIKRWLERAEFRVLEATNGRQALEILQARREEIHCIVLDVMMPDMDGFGVLEQMRENDGLASIPVIMLTARANHEEDQLRAANLGAAEHLSKPFSGPVLIAKVSRSARATMGQKALRARLDEAERASKVDALTGLYNRRHFDERLLAFRRRAEEEKIPFSMVLVDIDHFKSYNDKYGHAEGDRVLAHAAQCLKKCLRTDDMAFRYGGEEFALLLADRLRQKLATSPIQIAGNELNVKVSGGAVYVDEGERFESDKLVERADALLYLAKAQGRDRIFMPGEGQT
jgi:diguanylate cyclase (GGDEF)-like protein